MASSKSVISVSIIGDAKKLISAVGAADQATGGLVKSAAKVLVAGKVVTKGFDLVSDSLREADRRGDAIERLERSIGKIDTGKLTDTSDAFSTIGASSQDILELEAAYGDLATSAGIAAPDIAKNAEALSIAALAAAQVHDADPSAIIDAIGKAAGGSTRGLKPYGVDLTEAAVQQRAMKDTGKDIPGQLTDTELAAARVNLILEAFNPLVKNATDGTADFAQKQDELGAKFETVMGKIGAGVEGPLTDVLTFINDMIDAIPSAIIGWQLLGESMDDMLRDILTPIGRAADAVRGLLDLIGQAGNTPFQTSPGRAPRGSPGSGSDRNTAQEYQRWLARNGLGD